MKLFAIALFLIGCFSVSAAQNGLFSVAIEDASGLCAHVSAYNNFVVIEFQPPDQTAGFQTYDAEMVIDADTIYVTEEEETYSATYRIRYKYPFTADADIVFNDRSYQLGDLNTLNSFCGGQSTVFSTNIVPSGTQLPPPPVQPLTVNAQASATTGFAPLTVTFVAVASKPSSFVWRDNGVVFSTSPTPVLSFVNPSTHQIVVTAAAGSETATATLTITVQKKTSGSGGNGGNGSNQGGS